MNDWETANWQDVLTIKNGKNQKKVANPNGAYPIYGSGGKMGLANEYLCDAETTIIGRKGSINNPIYVQEKFWNVDTAFGLCAGEKLDNKFLFYFCITYNFLKHNKATTLPSLTKADLLRIKIPLPPLAEQQKIAAILDAADSLRQKDQQLIDHYTTLSQSLFLEMFGDPVTNPMGWEYKKLDDYIDYLADIGSNGANKLVAEKLVMTDEVDYAVMVRTVNFTAQDFKKNAKFVSKDVYNFFKKSQVFGGEMIMNKIGSAGAFWMMPKLDKPVSLGLNQFLIRYRGIAPNFVYYFLSTHFGKKNIQSRIRGAATKSITKAAVRDLPIFVPPKKQQNKFVERIKRIEAQKRQAQAGLKQSNALFNSLLQRAFNGELIGSKAE